MAKTDWTLTDTVKPDDFNNIGREINQLRTDVDHIEVPPASLTEAGIVQLSNATNSTSEAQAATSKAVKAAYDAAAVAQTTANAVNSAAAAAFQLGNERKAEVVAALVAWGISASTSESWDSLLSKMKAIINRGAQVITPGTTNKAIPAGYHNGSGYVVGDPDLIASNFPKDVNLFGIQGVLERMTTAEKQAIANAITGKGVAASASDSNTVLEQKIGQIDKGKKYATGAVDPAGGPLVVSGLDFAPDIFAYYHPGYSGIYGVAVHQSVFGFGFGLKYVGADGSGPSQLSHTFTSNGFTCILGPYFGGDQVPWIAYEL